MPFATVQDLTLRFGTEELMLLSDRHHAGEVDEAVVSAALEDADAEIVSMIGHAVAIDAANPPRNLRRVAGDIARYRLYGANPPEAVRKNYEDALAFLRRVADGKATLDGGALNPVAAVASPRPAATEPGERIFRRGLS